MAQEGMPAPSASTALRRQDYELAASHLIAYRREKVGRDWTEESYTCYVTIALTLMNVLGCGKDWACRLLSLTGRGYEHILKAVNGWLNNSDLGFTAPCKRGQGSPNYKLADESRRPVHLGPFHQMQILTWMEERVEDGQQVTAPMVQQFLERMGVNIGYSRLCKQLVAWGGKYKEAVEVVAVDQKWQEKRVAKYLVKYAEARKKEAAGTHVIVYTDESYVHSNHAPRKGWRLPGMQAFIPRDKRIGRLVIFHAITKDGLLLTHRDAVCDQALSEVQCNSEYIYEINPDASNKKDVESASNVTDKVDDKELYHGNIDTDMWWTWLHNRLIPSFNDFYKERCPKVKMILCMDNASYHNAADAAWVPVAKMKKEAVCCALEKYGIASFTAIRDNTVITFTQSQYRLRASKRSDGGPYTQELKVRLRAHFKQHPELVITRTRRLFQELGWELLFTPPLAPECQPIERVWGQVKSVVAKMYKLGRTMAETRQQLWHAFYTYTYGTKGEVQSVHLQGGCGVTAAHVQGSIRKSEKWEQEFIDAHPHLLHGTLDDLRFNTPALYPPDDKTAEEREREEDLADAAIEDGVAPLLEQLPEDDPAREDLVRTLQLMSVPMWTKVVNQDERASDGEDSGGEDEEQGEARIVRRLDMSRADMHMEQTRVTHMHKSLASAATSSRPLFLSHPLDVLLSQLTPSSSSSLPAASPLPPRSPPPSPSLPPPPPPSSSASPPRAPSPSAATAAPAAAFSSVAPAAGARCLSPRPCPARTSRSHSRSLR